jgi:hypothetical protein
MEHGKGWDALKIILLRPRPLQEFYNFLGKCLASRDFARDIRGANGSAIHAMGKDMNSGAHRHWGGAKPGLRHMHPNDFPAFAGVDNDGAPAQLAADPCQDGFY